MGAALRVVSYNVRYFSHAWRGIIASRRSLSRVAAALATLEPRPQLVCLQEVEAPSLRSRNSAQLEALTHALDDELTRRGQRSPYVAHHFPAYAVPPLYATGLGVLVDSEALTIVAHDTFTLSDDDARGERRIVAHLELRGPTPLHVFNTHLSLPSPLGTALGFGRNQLAQAERLAAFVRRRAAGQPFLLCGDFNARPESPVHRHVASGLHAPDGPASSAGIGPVRMRLDYLLGDGIRWLDSEGTHAFGDAAGAFHGLSDHVPLIARFEIAATNAPGG